MPYYTVIITNQSNSLDTIQPPGTHYVETVSAPDLATVELMVRHDLERFVDADQYSWTISESAEPAARVRSRASNSL